VDNLLGSEFIRPRYGCLGKGSCPHSNSLAPDLYPGFFFGRPSVNSLTNPMIPLPNLVHLFPCDHSIIGRFGRPVEGT